MRYISINNCRECPYWGFEETMFGSYCNHPDLRNEVNIKDKLLESKHTVYGDDNWPLCCPLPRGRDL